MAISFLNAILGGMLADPIMVGSRVPGLCVLSFVGIAAGLGMREYQRVRWQYMSRFPSPSTVDTK